MDILIVGGGGREHSLCWAISKSKECNKLYCAPGNAGIESIAECVNIQENDIAKLVKFAKKNDIDLVVIGPEVPLVLGLVDALEAENIRAFGPTAEAAKLEGSKVFMKDFFKRHSIPTANYQSFTNFDRAVAFIRNQNMPIVIKASGLAAGKGVIIAITEEDAIDALEQMMKKRVFGESGREVIIEEFLEGEEVSFFALVDGKTAIPLISIQDHKTAYDGDKGPNTGGMGAYSPASIITNNVALHIMTDIIEPTIKAMNDEGYPYKGVLFAGLMVKNGKVKILEFNVRFGDPECQVLMARLDSDIVRALDATVTGDLKNINISWKKEAALVVVMASKGYPGKYQKGSQIENIEKSNGVDGVTIFHAGTKVKNGQIISNGGRVLGVTALGSNVKEAQKRAYTAVDLINWKEGFCRSDIGWREIRRE
jgi:phosphoribosylamine--glycine ligase